MTCNDQNQDPRRDSERDWRESSELEERLREEAERYEADLRELAKR